MRDRGLRVRSVLFGLAICAIHPMDAVAETANYFSGEPVVSGPPRGVGGSAASIASGITSQQDPNSLNFSNQEAADNDRRRQLEAARDRSNKGNAAAIAAGVAMTAAAVPMLASGIPSVIAQGAILMGMAGLEFAQAGADRGSANKNNGGAKTLTEKANQEAQQAGVPKVDNPQLNKMLADRGVNPDDFNQRLANGEITNANDVLNAVGNTTPISTEDMEKGTAAGVRDGEAIATSEMKRLGYDESNAVTAASGAASDSALVSKASSSEKHDTNGTLAGAAPESSQASFAPNRTSPVESDKEKAAGVPTGTLMDMLAAVNGLSVEEAEKVPIAKLLEGVGIMKTHSKQNIFQVAHRIFRGYGKWRKKIAKDPDVGKSRPMKKPVKPAVVALRASNP